MISENEQKIGMRFGVYEGIAASIMFVIINMFLSVFALFLGADNTTIGLIVSLPAVISVIFYIPSAMISERFNKKTICTATCFLSRVVWIFIGMVPFLTSNPIFWLLILISAYSFFSAFIGPAWASLMGEIVPESERGKYFGFRNRLCSIFSLITGISAGVVVHFFNNAFGFMIVFLVAGIAGIASAVMFSKFPDVRLREERIHMTREVADAFKNPAFRTFMLIFGLWQFGIFLSVPFFNVYLVRNLGADYIWLSIIVLVSGISTIVVQRGWGNISDVLGHRAIMIVSGIGISFVPFLWIIIPSPEFVILIYIISGASWAGFGISSFNYLLDITRDKRRAIYTAIFWSVTGVSVIFAPVLGGFIADAVNIYASNGLRYVFLISWIIRLLGVMLFAKMLWEYGKRKKLSILYLTGEVIHMGFSSLYNHHFQLLKGKTYVFRSISFFLHKIKRLERKYLLSREE